MPIRAVAVVVSLFAWCSGAAHGVEKPNVLFIVVDDLNHWVGHLGRNPQAKTPNIDRLAKRGVTFTQAHCAAPLCNPSRAAALSGRRPSSTGVYDNDQDWKPAIPVEQTLTTQFLNAGYNVYGAGKIYHGGRREAEWSEYFSRARGTPMRRDPSAPNDGVGGIKFYPLSNSDEEMPDYQAVSYALGQLDREHDKPFFLAVGLSKVHMPFSVPKKYFEMFPLETIQLPPHREDDLADVPPAGVRMARPNTDHAAIVASGRWKEAIQAYLATMAFCDAMIGRLLGGFDKSRYRDNTIVVFWGDHGWHFGEKSHWRKFTLWEEATRAPFIWIAPGVTKPGGVCDRPVDFMSIYPTLCDLAGLTKPAHVEGWSIRPLLENPDAEWKHPALTTFHRDNHAVRSADWRYIRYADGGEELYDHRSDPYEWTNRAGDPERAAIKAELAKAMPQENHAELPRATARAQNRRARTNAAPSTAPPPPAQ